MNKEKIVLPKEVAKCWEYLKDEWYSFYGFVSYVYEEPRYLSIAKWLEEPENEKKLMRVWMGEEYEVEEPLYYVEIPDGEDTEYIHRLRKFSNGKIELSGPYHKPITVEECNKLTEKEIKSADERFWAFKHKVKD